MRNRTRMIAAAAAVTAALAAGSAAAVASTGAKPGARAKAMSASEEPGGSKAVGSKSAEERQGHDAITAAVAQQLHVSTARVNAALQPLFAAGRADTSSPVIAAAARSLGVSTQQLFAALAHAKQSLAGSTHASEEPGGSKAVGSKSAEERRGHDAITAAVAQQLHVSTARVNAALQPLFAAGRADTSSPVIAAAARSLGVSTQQLFAALAHAKQSLAGSTHASEEPGGSKAVGSKSAEERQGHDAITAAVAQQLHVSTARVNAALQPLFAAGRADTSSPVIAAAARSLGVSTQQLFAALAHAKQSLAGSTHASEEPGGSKAVGSKSAEERQGHDAITAAVAQQLHVSTARVNAALQPLFAAGRADTSSPVFAAAARSLGVSTQQLFAALAHAKQSLAGSTHASEEPGGSKAVGSKSAEERQGHDAITAAVAQQLHV